MIRPLLRVLVKLLLRLDPEWGARMMSLAELSTVLGRDAGQRHTRARLLERFIDNLCHLRADSHVDHFRSMHSLVLQSGWNKQNTEKLLAARYHSRIADLSQADELRSNEFKVYSQNGEDGIILYVLSKIGVSSRRYVNIGSGGQSSNSANLFLNYGWCGVEIDGSADALAQFRDLHLSRRKPDGEGIETIQAQVTRENVNAILESHAYTGEIDLLSIDVDGNDYWIWEALDIVNPRLVVLEYNAFFGKERALSVVYDPEFERVKKHFSTWYCGASLCAFYRLGRRKGYTLVGCESNGVNAFFVRDDLLGESFAEVSPGEAYYSHFQADQRITREGLRSLLEEMNYVEV
jgi:hypothetical protein